MAIDPRGPRFSALITTAVLAVVGCEMYLLIRRIWPGRQALAPANADKEI